MNFAIISYLLFQGGFAADLPRWVTDTPLQDDEGVGIVICSSSSLDPEKAKKLAEDACLASALKALGVTMEVKSKSVQSLSGSDSSEVVESVPINKSVRCLWQNQYIEKDKDSYRVWLKCQYSKKPSESQIETLKTIEAETSSKKGASANSTIHLIIAPSADKILIENIHSGERVIKDNCKELSIDLKDGDSKLIIKKLSYKDSIIELDNLKDGDTLAKTVILIKEI